MKVLVLNSGSSSVKFQLFVSDDGAYSVLAKGMAQRIGLSGASLKCSCPAHADRPCPAVGRDVEIPDHAAAISQICEHLLADGCGAIRDLSELVGLGHRVVHGAERFTGSVLIDDEVVEGIEDCARLAPLHNPPALLGIKACADIFEGIPQVAVFDTAFYHTVPKRTFVYGIPIKYYDEHGIRKYGFHGTSHMYVAQEAAKILGKPFEETRVITCHLGNGCSITAVKDGEAVDTSMGLTPLGGVMMGTRPGDFDPYVPIFMSRELGIPIDEVDHALNKESGLKGICGKADMRDVKVGAEAGDEQCALALDMFVYRIARYIGAYSMVVGGPDAVVFTAGIGENDHELRSRILANAGFLGISIDSSRNAANELDISAPGAKVRTLVIPTNEELVIARETTRVVEAALARA